MIIIGPLSQGVRLLFTISFSVPSQYTTEVGNAIITDTLPTGLSLYTDTSTKNSVTIDGLPVSDGVSFSKAAVATCIINSSKLTADSEIVVTFDTIISSSGLARNTSIENKSALTFSASSKFVSTGGTVVFQVTGIDDISYVSPDHAPFNHNSDIAIALEFTASLNTDTYNYHIGSDFGNNMTFDKTLADAVTINYNKGGVISPVQRVTITDPASAGSNRYIINFPNDPDIESSVITVVIKAKTNYEAVAPESITYKYDLSIGGAIGEIKTQLIPVSIEVPLIKNVIDI